MTSRGMVSVVLPTYNGSRYLAEAIEGCLRQTYPYWELIVVDDASTDETPRIVESFQRREGRIRAVRNDTNMKLPHSLNRGFRISRGQYLTWTSDDNVYRPDALSVLVGHLEENVDIGLVYASFSVLDESGRAVPGWAGPPEELLIRNVVGGCFMYRRHLRDVVGDYDPRLFLAEDYDYWLRSLAVSRLAWIDRDLYVYRSHPESLTSRRRTEIERAHVACLIRALPRVGTVPKQTKERAYAHLLARVTALRLHHLRAPLVRRRLRVDGSRPDLWPLAFLLAPSRVRPRLPWHGEWAWLEGLRHAHEMLPAVLPRGTPVLVADWGDWLFGEELDGREVIPFMELDGVYWGPPPDEASAIWQLERARRRGARAFVIADHARWLYRTFPAFLAQLRRYHPVRYRDRWLTVHDLGPLS
jgi:glycosyltransferase involved in cell wall biosynthesis